MRYRPFGRSGVSVSAVTLKLTDRLAVKGPAAVRDLIYAALELGVNSFHMASNDPDLPNVVGEALQTLERRLVFVSARLGVQAGRGGEVRDFSPEALTAAIDGTLSGSGLQHLDLALLDDPAEDELPQASLTALKAQRSAGRIGMLGAGGADDAVDAYLSTGAFDVLATPFNVGSGWKVRNRIKAAVDLDMAVIGFDSYPAALISPETPETQVKRGLFRRAAPPPTAARSRYAFLRETPKWTPQALCLGYSLTEPSLATVWIEAEDAETLAEAARAPERELPSGVSAQIEIARFTHQEGASAGAA